MRTAGALLFCAAMAAAGSETPPAGPPWVTGDFAGAQRRALKEGKPLFCYFTKTY